MSSAQKPLEYKCSHCGGEFTSDRGDEEAMEEARELWASLAEKPEETRVVCDACFRTFYDPRVVPADAKA